MKIFSLIILCISYIGAGAKPYEKLWLEGNKHAQKNTALALKYYFESKNLAQSEHNLLWAANVCPDICGAYFKNGDMQSALEICEEGLGLYQKSKLKADSILFKIYSSLATCHASFYQMGKAVDFYNLANELLQKRQNIEKETLLFATYHYANQAVFWLNLYDLKKAESYFKKAIYLSDKLSNKSYKASIMANYSQTFGFLGDYQTGVSYLEKALAIIIKDGGETPQQLSDRYFLLGTLLRKTGDYKSAIGSILKSESLAKGDDRKQTRAQLALADIYLETNDKFNFKKILQRLDAGPIHEYQLDYQILLAKYFRTTDSQKALMFLKTALKNGFSNENLFFINPYYIDINRLKLYEIAMGYVAIYESKYKSKGHLVDLESCLRYQKQAIVIGKAIRFYQDTFESKAFYTQKYYSLYHHTIQTAYELYQKKSSPKLANDIFLMAESAKSVILEDKLNFSVTNRNATLDSLIAKLNAYKSYLSYLKNATEKNTQQIEEYEINAFYIRHEISKLSKKTLKKNNKTAPRKLDNKTLYLNYLLSDNQLFIFEKSNKNIFINKLSVENKLLKSKIESFNKNLMRPPAFYQSWNDESSAVYLYKILISHLKHPISKFERLVINPDNAFYNLSFDVLIEPTTHAFLINTHAISYTNNLKNTLIKPYHKANQTWTCFFPFANETNNMKRDFGQLKYDLYETKGIKSQIFSNNLATKENFLSQLSAKNNSPLLIITHSVGDENDPYLIFNNKNDKNAKLYASEIGELNLQVPLVILSSCETNKGKVLDGLGVFSFAEQLQYAGCPSVAGSFWQVEDHSMSVLSQLFYKNLMLGMPKDVALQKAKINYLKSPIGLRNDIPFYWAHLQILGDVQPIVPNYRYLRLLVIVLIFGLIFIFKGNSLKTFLKPKLGFKFK